MDNNERAKIINMSYLLIRNRIQAMTKLWPAILQMWKKTNKRKLLCFTLKNYLLLENLTMFQRTKSLKYKNKYLSYQLVVLSFRNKNILFSSFILCLERIFVDRRNWRVHTVSVWTENDFSVFDFFLRFDGRRMMTFWRNPSEYSYTLFLYVCVKYV